MEDSFDSKKKEDDVFVFGDLWTLFLSKWYWFAISLFVCLFIAVIYIATTVPIYTRSTSILIKDDSKNKGLNTNLGGFDDISLFNNNANINNEMIAINAPIMMEGVVDKLGLDIDITENGKLKERSLYGFSPITVSIYKNKDLPLGFDVELGSNRTISLKHFEQLGEPLHGEVKTIVGKMVNTPVGYIKIESTNFFSQEDMGRVLHVQKFSKSDIARKYSRGLSVSLADKDASIINLTLQDENIMRADSILLTLIDVYNESWVNDKNKMAIATSKFIDERLVTIQDELGKVDKTISDYRSQNLLPDVQAVSNMYMTQANKSSDQLLALTNQLSMAKFIKNFLSDATKKNQLLPTNSGVDNNGSVEKQILDYNTLLLDRNRVIANSSEKNPLAIDQERALQQMRSVIVKSIDNVIALIEKQIKNYQESESSTMAQIASTPRKAQSLLSDERQQKVKEALYIYLLQKREENELSKAYSAYNSRMIQPPMGSVYPTSPRKGMILLCALALGLAIPAIILILLENLNTTVRGRKDIESINVPFAGEIPLVGKKKSYLRKHKPLKRQILVKEQGRDIINEAFRIVRSKIGYLNTTGQEHVVFMATSLNPGSGKTFITMNLAESFAIQRKKTILVDLDLRRNSMSQTLLHHKVKNGVTSYLSQQTDSLDDLIVKGITNEYLDLLPVGVIPPNPAEILLGGRLETLIEELKKNYDYIFLDCPPAEIVADASIIKDYADITLFVIRVGVLDRRLLADVEQFHTEHKFKNMAIILNACEQRTSKYGYRKYSYRYGYGGGYYNTKES